MKAHLEGLHQKDPYTNPHESHFDEFSPTRDIVIQSCYKNQLRIVEINSLDTTKFNFQRDDVVNEKQSTHRE